MITNQDRSKWFGASETSIIVGNWNTQTFHDWWTIKCGYKLPKYTSWAMQLGNILEIPIIKKLEQCENRRIRLGRRPVYRRRLRLRANYDGITDGFVVEIKTSKHGFDKVPKNYWQQCQVLMFATKRYDADLYCYTLIDEEYDCPYFAEIDGKRIRYFRIKYDVDFINNDYLPKLKYLAYCLRKGIYPTLEGFNDRRV